jgi:putative SOS response-associated peptidase YedK
MCGRFEQSETPRYYANALRVHISEQLKRLGDNSPSYNVAPGQTPWMIMLHSGELLFIGTIWIIQPRGKPPRRRNLGYAPEWKSL